MNRIVLVGFMGSGKSTVGKELAKAYELPFIEMDLAIEKTVGKSIATIFSDIGEVGFREKETGVLKASLSQEGVIATGGGVVTQEMNLNLLRNEGCVIYLKGELETLTERIQQDKVNNRPLAKDDKSLKALFASREAAYESVATWTVSVDNKSVLEIVSEIKGHLEGVIG